MIEIPEEYRWIKPGVWGKHPSYPRPVLFTSKPMNSGNPHSLYQWTVMTSINVMGLDDVREPCPKPRIAQSEDEPKQNRSRTEYARSQSRMTSDANQIPLQPNLQIEALFQEFAESIRDFALGDVSITINLDVPFVSKRGDLVCASNRFERHFKKEKAVLVSE